MQTFDVHKPRFTQTQVNRLRNQKPTNYVQQKISLVSIPKWEYLIYLLATPLLVYVVIYIPDIQFNTEYGFIEKHQQQIGYHQMMVEKTNIHIALNGTHGLL